MCTLGRWPMGAIYEKRRCRVLECQSTKRDRTFRGVDVYMVHIPCVFDDQLWCHAVDLTEGCCAQNTEAHYRPVL